ncbi:MAG: hypothetical protein IT561_24255 [Alphaproteobacteria bacterium]|nr:hypothetical protein [Alphaproteobacteria bacterium]
MNGAELLRRLRPLAKQDGVAVDYDAAHGKGSHGRLSYGDRFTTLKDPRKEIGGNLLRKMLRDLGIDARRLR